MTEPRESPAAFISHASTDANLAHALVERLERSGVRCWIAPRDIRQGEVYAEEIMRGIRACPVFILLHSEAADRSQFVWREANEAVTLGRTILPIRLGDFEAGDRMRFLLAAIQWQAAEVRDGVIDHRALADRVARLLENPRTDAPVSVGPAPAIAQGRRSLLLTAGVTAVAAVASGLWLWLPTPQPLEGRLDVRVLSDEGERSLGSDGPAPVRDGDRLRIEALLNRPGFVYVAWISREGVVPVFPWLASDWTRRSEEDVLRERLGLPTRGDRGYPMKCDSGVEAVLLLVRSSPLPRTLDLADMLGGFPWRAPSEGSASHCHRLTADGVEWLGSGSGTHGEPGTRPADFLRLEQELAAEAESIAPLRAWWADAARRLQPHFEHVDGLAFTTAPADGLGP